MRRGLNLQLRRAIRRKLPRRRRTALASFPRSGNTWVRYMVEQATKQSSGSIYDDRVMPRGRDGIVIKTHLNDSSEYTHAIHLIRNPFDATESFFRWRTEIDNQANLNWEKHLAESTLQWRRHTEHWRDCQCNKYRLRYEDLVRDTVHELNLLLLWLGKDLSHDALEDVVRKAKIEQMRKINAKIGDRFFKSGQIGRGKEVYNESERSFVLDALGDLLIELSYC